LLAFSVLGAFCGIASLAWLIAQQLRMTRANLRLSTARALTGGLDVLIQYRPDRARVGLRARITLIEPEAATLLTGIRQERGDRYGAYAIAEPDEASSGQVVDVPLRHLRPDPKGVVCGVFYVTGGADAPPTTAKIRLEIWTAAGPTRLEQIEATLQIIEW
jgi:hypothetical protein